MEMLYAWLGQRQSDRCYLCEFNYPRRRFGEVHLHSVLNNIISGSLPSRGIVQPGFDGDPAYFIGWWVNLLVELRKALYGHWGHLAKQAELYSCLLALEMNCDFPVVEAVLNQALLNEPLPTLREIHNHIMEHVEYMGLGAGTPHEPWDIWIIPKV